MFRVEFFVEDAKLSKALRALAGIALKPGPVSQPVENAKVENKEIVAKASGAKTKSDILFEKLKGEYSGQTMTNDQITALANAVGLAAGFSGDMPQRAVKAHVVKRLSRGVYKIL